MFASLRSKLTYANVASSIALFVALSGGVAYAANTIGSTDIIDGQVKTVDIGDLAVTNAKLAANAVGTGKIIDGTVSAADIANGGVNSNKLFDGSVSAVDLGDGAVTNFKLASGSVTHSKLGSNAIDGSNVANNSLTLSDLLGANVTGAISFSLGANTCGNLSLGVSGAQVGQAVLITATGSTTVPNVVFGLARVTAANSIVVRACNVSASTVSVTNLGVRVVTFG